MDRFLRQRLLPEIGDAGQRRLEQHTVRPMGGPDGRVRDLYLRRAGVEIDDGDAEPGRAFEALANDADLLPALAVLAGAFEAVEEMKRVLGVGTAGSLDEVWLGSGDDVR